VNLSSLLIWLTTRAIASRSNEIYMKLRIILKKLLIIGVVLAWRPVHYA